MNVNDSAYISTPSQGCNGHGVTAFNLAGVSGVAVFPCKPDKSPLTPNGFKDASTDLDQICTWWTQWPDALVGVPTGSATGIDALDIDPRHGGNVWYEQHCQDLPDTRTHQTRSGGLHILFKAHPGLRNSAGKIAPGIDVRAEGGYVIWWPALHEHGICDWPQWLIEKQEKRHEESQSSSSSDQHASLLDVASALSVIPNCAAHHNRSFDDWNRVAMAVHAATGGSDAGYQCFLDWSRQHPTFSKDDTKKRWEQMTGSPPDKIGAGSLFYLAKQASPTWEIPSHRRPDGDEFTAEAKPGTSAEDRQARREALIARLSINAWVERDIPPADRLLGDLLTTTARVFLVGRTGLGKTNLAVAIAAAIATGEGFLHWPCARPGRVLYLDGEMPQELIRSRSRDAASRLGKPIPDGNLIIYSAVDAEDFAVQFPELGILPPLNTPAGHQWVQRFIDACGGFDLVILDNVMSLIEGDNKEEISWSGTFPLVNWFSANRIGQLWLDHTGHNETRQYGSSTKAWRFDAVGIMSPVDGAADPDGELSFQLSFDHPGKARRRTPDNWRDFQTVKITLSADGWSHEPVSGDGKAKGGGKRISREQAWLADIRDIFAKRAVQGLTGLMEAPIGQIKLARSIIRDGLKACGRFELDGKGHLTASDRTQLKATLNSLRDQGFIGMDENEIWLA
jgi:Bifunctional DNA primase/polymerase, N-terminal/AAA domain/Primase C terminal 2 (PriCT-2)